MRVGAGPTLLAPWCPVRLGGKPWAREGREGWNGGRVDFADSLFNQHQAARP